jgi:cobalt-zinc-cadmium efflux system protein
MSAASSVPDGGAAHAHAHGPAAQAPGGSQQGSDSDHDRDHHHGLSPEADRRYVGIALALLSAFLIGEVVAGALSGSLALLADAGHMLTDVAALAASLWALRLATRPATDTHTFGLHRAEVLSAAGNGITLVAVAAVVLSESIRRLISPPPVTGGVIIVVAVVGVAVNIVATWVLARANRTNMAVAGSYAHVVTDLYAFLGTAIAGVVVVTTGFRRADAIASLVVVGLMAHAAWQLLRASGRVLLEAAPEGVALADVRRHLLSTPHVVDVHDLHAWMVTTSLPALSAHVVVEESCFLDGHAPQILDHLQACLAGHFDVSHSSFQLEPVGHAAHEEGAHA